MKDYTDLGIGPKMVKTASLAGSRDYTSALEENMRKESTPYLNRTAIGKGTVQTNLGGVLDLYDKTGGTKVLTYNPSTGVVTILGSLIANEVSTGTYSNIVIAGTSTLSGTLTGGVLAGNTVGSPSVTNGTINNAVFGTPAITGGTSTSSVINAPTIGSPSITSGTITNGVVNSSTIGTPDITGGTHDSAIFGTPTLQTPTIDGTPNFDINSGSAALTVNGDFAVQTHTGSAILVIRHGGTTFYFTSAGTLA